jgi:GTP-binding protein Era
MAFKSGFVTVVGRPNVGKSTLINTITGEKVAIISDKPQTTRNTIKSIVTGENFQIIFIDTPGIHKPRTKLGEYMVNVATGTLNEVDIVLFMVEATDIMPGTGDMHIIEQLKGINTPVILIINKIDLVKKENILALISNYNRLMEFEACIPISALAGIGMEELFKEIKKLLPVGPKYFPDDMVTDQPERIIVAEMIREKALQLLKEEIPHGIGVEIISFKRRDNKDIVDIQANIYCEKESHKGIVIGKGGNMLKKIGTLSREDIENFLETKIFLQLWVKVKPDWRNSSAMLKLLGYQ